MNEPAPPPGEPPVSPEEERLGRFVEAMQDRLRCGEPVVVEALLGDRPDLYAEARELARDLGALWRAAPDPTASVARAPGVPQPFPTDFLLTRLLGEGTFGRVWLAEDLHLPRLVALKTPKIPKDAGDPAVALAALQKEAGFLAKLSHPNVVRVHAWRQAAGEHFLVMEYVAGGSLADLVQKEPMPWGRATRYIADVADGLQEVHRAGIVHRDIKPANILWDPEADEAKLTDFGVAGRLMNATTITGTPVYMAPEVFGGRSTDASDVYSLALTLFRLVAGEAPFRGADLDDQMRLIRNGLPDPDDRLAGVPAAVERLIREGLTADPARRPLLADFAARLRGALNQSLAADLGTPAPGLHIVVSREKGPDRWERVAATPRPGGPAT